MARDARLRLAESHIVALAFGLLEPEAFAVFVGTTETFGRVEVGTQAHQLLDDGEVALQWDMLAAQLASQLRATGTRRDYDVVAGTSWRALLAATTVVSGRCDAEVGTKRVLAVIDLDVSHRRRDAPPTDA